MLRYLKEQGFFLLTTECFNTKEFDDDAHMSIWTCKQRWWCPAVENETKVSDVTYPPIVHAFSLLLSVFATRFASLAKYARKEQLATMLNFYWFDCQNFGFQISTIRNLIVRFLSTHYWYRQYVHAHLLCDWHQALKNSKVRNMYMYIIMK